MVELSLPHRRPNGLLSAAQPPDQGEVSVVHLIIVGGTIIDLTKYSFWE